MMKGLSGIGSGAPKDKPLPRTIPDKSQINSQKDLSRDHWRSSLQRSFVRFDRQRSIGISLMVLLGLGFGMRFQTNSKRMHAKDETKPQIQSFPWLLLHLCDAFSRFLVINRREAPSILFSAIDWSWSNSCGNSLHIILCLKAKEGNAGQRYRRSLPRTQCWESFGIFWDST
jgi:hypothetical protein